MLFIVISSLYQNPAIAFKCRREDYERRTLVSAVVRTELCTSPASAKLILLDGFSIGGLCARGVVWMVSRSSRSRSGCLGILEWTVVASNRWDVLIKANIAL